MIAESCDVRVTAVAADGSSREQRYNARDVRRMAFDICSGDLLTEDAEARAFLHGFAACLDVLAAGLLSPVYPLGAAIRAKADYEDPEGLPGGITDVERYAGHGGGDRR